MARAWFGGAATDLVVSTVNFGNRKALTLANIPGGLTVWDAEVGGNRYTDLQTPQGVGTSVVTLDDASRYGFFGPDGVHDLWVDDGFGTRTLLVSVRSLLQIGTGVVARAENRTGIATTGPIFPANAAPVPSCVIDVQPSGDLRVKVEAQMCWRLTAAGAGTLDIQLYDITGGVATLICEDKLPVSGDLGTTGIFPNQWMSQDVGIVATPRQFALYCRVRRASGSALAAEVLNSAGVGVASLNRHSEISARTE